MPGYGKQTSAAGRALWRACRDSSGVSCEYAHGSLLACNFNKLWCTALNMVHNGQRLDYFAMLHDDIGCEDFWLDALINELEDKKLDVLGVVVPIKDMRGLTSIAIYHPGDNWNIDCRLSMHDVYDLPETFTGDDLGGVPLLLNTGCWVIKWNQEICRKLHFEINDRIVFDIPQNCYRPEVESEDWFFSRICHEHGLKLGATRKIAVKHEGDIEFSNTFPWGSSAFDHESPMRSRRISPVPGAFPRDIIGWLSEEEGKALAELVQGKRVLEIGSYCGLSTICMARTAAHVTSVDPHDGRGTPAPQETWAKFCANINRYGLSGKVTGLIGTITGDDAVPIDDEFDIVFIDGAHDYESVTADIEAACELLKSDGVLILHDYKAPCHPGIERAIDDLILEGGEILSVHNTLAVVRPPAAILLEV